MRKIICLCFTLFVVLIFSSISYANVLDTGSLRGMTDEERYDFLVEKGMKIPDCFNNYSEIQEFVSDIVECVIDNPTRVDWFNFSETQSLAMDIRTIVLQYENIDIANNKQMSLNDMIRSTYNLQYSSLVPGDSPWNSTYEKFNCYTYALWGYNLSKYNPGAMSGISISKSDYATMTVSRLASIVSYDLQSEGCTDIKYDTSFPETKRLSGTYRIISLRKSDVDYHFMHLYNIPLRQWRHKPSTAVPMIYNYTNLTLGRWTDEGLYRNGYLSPTKEYDSDIIYISYIP